MPKIAGVKKPICFNGATTFFRSARLIDGFEQKIAGRGCEVQADQELNVPVAWTQ